MAKFEQTPKEEEEKAVRHSFPTKIVFEKPSEPTEELEVVSEPEQVKFDYQEAINNKDFLDFLARYADAESLEISEQNSGEIEWRYNAFENKAWAAKELESIYKEELEETFDIKLSPANLEAIARYLDKEALENMDQLADRVYEIRAYRDLQAEKERLEKEIVELGGEQNMEKARQEIAAQLKAAKKERKTGEWALGWRGMINPKNVELLDGLFKFKGRETRKIVKKGWAYVPVFFRQADEKIASLAKKEEFLERYPTMKAATEAIFNNLRLQFFENFEPAKALVEEAAQETIENLKEFLVKGGIASESLKVLEAGQRYLEKIESAKSGLPVGELKHLPLAAFQEQLDRKFEQVVSENIFQSVKDFKIGHKPLEAMREGLKTYLSREKLGSKDRQKIKNFVGAVITEQIDKLLKEKPKNYNQKIMLLKVILTDIAAYE